VGLEGVDDEREGPPAGGDAESLDRRAEDTGGEGFVLVA